MLNQNIPLSKPATDNERDAFLRGEFQSGLKLEESIASSLKEMLSGRDTPISLQVAEYSIVFNRTSTNSILHVECREDKKNCEFFLNVRTGDYLYQGENGFTTFQEFIQLALDHEEMIRTGQAVKLGLDLMLSALKMPELEAIPFTELQPNAGPLIEDLLESGGECWNEQNLAIIREGVMIALMDNRQHAELMYLTLEHSNLHTAITLAEEDMQKIIKNGLSDATSEQIYAILSSRETFFILADAVFFQAFSEEDSPWTKYIPDLEIPAIKPLKFPIQDGENC